MIPIIRYLLWTLLVLIGLAITSLNADPVVLNYYKSTISLPLSLSLLFSFSIGWLIGLGLNLINHIKLKAANHRLQTRYQQAESELIRLKKTLSSTTPQNSPAEVSYPDLEWKI